MEIDKEKYIEALIERGKTHEEKKIDYEFQEIGLELERIFGKENKKRIWPIFYQKGMTEDRVRRAINEYNKRRFSYFIWILNKIIK